jgi:hypothetical protein
MPASLSTVVNLPLASRSPTPASPPQSLAQIVAWTETGCCYEIDGCEFGGVKAHAFGSIEHLAFTRIVDEKLKVFRALMNRDPQSFPFRYVSLPVPRFFVILARVPILRNSS